MEAAASGHGSQQPHSYYAGQAGSSSPTQARAKQGSWGQGVVQAPLVPKPPCAREKGLSSLVHVAQSCPSSQCHYSPVLVGCQVGCPGAKGLLSQLPLQVGRDFRSGAGHGQCVPFRPIGQVSATSRSTCGESRRENLGPEHPKRERGHSTGGGGTPLHSL